MGVLRLHTFGYRVTTERTDKILHFRRHTVTSFRMAYRDWGSRKLNAYISKGNRVLLVFLVTGRKV